MILSAAVSLFAVSAVACFGAALMDAGLRRLGTPTRFVWLGALTLGPVLLGARALSVLRRSDPIQMPAWVPIADLPPITLAQAGPASVGMGWEEAAAAAWLLSGLVLVLLVVRTHRLLLKERLGWESTQVMGRDVFVSADRGPAVAGMWDPWIVLPRWVLALPEKELRMVLLHEEEHMRARDTVLLGGALILVALSAWNPVTWWQLRRLRIAMELDCDQRVLREAPDRAVYGASLLTVAARSAGPSLGLAAFTERSLNLKRRILTMTAKTSRMTAVGGGVLVVLGLAVGVQACAVESPVGLQPAAEALPVQAPAPRRATEPEPTGSTPDGGLVFTPFTQPPRVLNGDRIVAALQSQYPPLLADAGVKGTARVFMFVDTMGTVQDVRIDRTSGHQALDDAALKVAGLFLFDPARNQDQKVESWVAFPIPFGPAGDPMREPVRSEDPPPAPSGPVDPNDGPVFTPFTVAPSIVNRAEVIQAMVQQYPPELRAAKIGGTVRVYFFIDTEGNVGRSLIDRSSGQPEIDDAALRVATVYRFTPAMNKDQKVPVWVSFPITFMAR